MYVFTWMFIFVLNEMKLLELNYSHKIYNNFFIELLSCLKARQIFFYYLILISHYYHPTLHRYILLLRNFDNKTNNEHQLISAIKEINNDILA